MKGHPRDIIERVARCVSRTLACVLPRRRLPFHVRAFLLPLYAVDGGANGDRLAFLPVGRFLPTDSVSPPRPPTLSLQRDREYSSFAPVLLASRPKARRVFLSKYSPVVISRKTPFFSPETGEILAYTSIAGERGNRGRGEGEQKREVGHEGGRREAETRAESSRATWLEEKLLRFRIRCVCSGLIGLRRHYPLLRLHRPPPGEHTIPVCSPLPLWPGRSPG